MVSGNINTFAADRPPAGGPAAARRAPPLALIAAATAIGFCALHMVVPTLPILARVFDRGAAEVQLVLTLYFLGIAIGQLFYGPVSDRFGRRPVLLAGLWLFLAGTALCGFAPSLPVLIGGRVAQAIGACAGLVLGRAIIRDVYDRDASARGIAIVMMAMTLAPAVSPAIGAYVSKWFGWRAMFALHAVFGLSVLAWTHRRLAETRTGLSPLICRESAGPIAPCWGRRQCCVSRYAPLSPARPGSPSSPARRTFCRRRCISRRAPMAS